MLKKLLFASFLIPAIAFSQTSEVVSIGSGYTEQVWFDLETGQQTSRPSSEWDIAFEIQGFESSILANTQKAGLVLYEAPYTVADWAALDTTGIGSWTQLQNSAASWSKGAFNQGLTSDSLDLGWGNYNFITHIVTGDSLYVISLANGVHKKLRIDALAGGQYLFTYADLDGSNEVAGNIDKVDYTDKNFAYYSIENDMEIDREPLNTEWDITFVKYIDFVPTPYGVTGVLVNKWARSGMVDNTPIGSADWNTTSFDGSMNGIGFDWKSFNMTSFQWEIQDSLTYFVESRDGNIWELVFTGFGGAATGEFFFDYQQVSATGLSDIAPTMISVYPNPSNGIVNINLSPEVGSRFLTVFDIAGKAVRSLDLNGSSDMVTVDLTEVPSGLYLLELLSNTSRTVARVMVEH